MRYSIRIEPLDIEGLALHEEATRICRELKMDVIYSDKGLDTFVPYIQEGV